jgi:hypothetical protein
MGPYWAFYGLCGGPEPHNYNWQCLIPGNALCQICNAQFGIESEWPEDMPQRKQTCTPDPSYDTFWDVWPPTSNETIWSCCEDVRDIALNMSHCEPTGTETPPLPQYRLHCLWKLFVDCTGLRDKGGVGWSPAYWDWED